MTFSIVPPITPVMRKAAKHNPGAMLTVVDPDFRKVPDVPGWAVVGKYPIDENGEIIAQFEPNPEYLPSPTTLKYPKPFSALERALQRISLQQVSGEELVRSFLESAVYIYAQSEFDGNITGFPDEVSGRIMIPVCTSLEWVPSFWPGSRMVAGRDLVPLLQGSPIVLNPHSSICAVVPAEHLVALAGL